MQGYDVVTSDDHKIGTVVDVRDDCLIVEHGHVFKAKHAIPRTFVSVDDAANVVRATITKDVFSDSPKVNDDWNCNVVLEHYGLAGGFAAPEEEYGERIETTPPEQERVAIRENEAAPTDQPAVRERHPNALDPTGTSANLD